MQQHPLTSSTLSESGRDVYKDLTQSVLLYFLIVVNNQLHAGVSIIVE